MQDIASAISQLYIKVSELQKTMEPKIGRGGSHLLQMTNFDISIGVVYKLQQRSFAAKRIATESF